MDAEISVFFLSQLASAAPPPAVIDVRLAPAVERDPRVIPDAMYAWCRQAAQETHGWNPAALRKAAAAA